MSFYVLYAILAVYVVIDTIRRKNNVIGWPLGTLVIGPIFLPIYFAKRNLRTGEVREGGTGWNIMKNFALLWTLTIAVVTIAGFLGISKSVSENMSDAEAVGTALGAGLGFGLLGFIWFGGVVTALIIGIILKKSSIIENGPTGKLADTKV